MRRVLIIEDDATMLRGLQDNFEAKGYYVTAARDGQEGLRAALEEKPDIIILDIMLPEMNGYEVCSHVREKKLDMPIIMLTAKDQEKDIVLGLNLGADDYVTKPFSIRELLARVDAFLRRRGQDAATVYEFGPWRLDVSAKTLTQQGQAVTLTPGEFKLLHLFCSKQGCPLTQEEIRDAVWGYSRFISLKDVDRAVDALQKKIEPDPTHPTFIHAISLIGYKFEPRQTHGDSTDR